MLNMRSWQETQSECLLVVGASANVGCRPGSRLASHAHLCIECGCPPGVPPCCPPRLYLPQPTCRLVGVVSALVSIGDGPHHSQSYSEGTALPPPAAAAPAPAERDERPAAAAPPPKRQRLEEPRPSAAAQPQHAPAPGGGQAGQAPASPPAPTAVQQTEQQRHIANLIQQIILGHPAGAAAAVPPAVPQAQPQPQLQPQPNSSAPLDASALLAPTHGVRM